MKAYSEAVKDALVHALTQYDMKQVKKRGYNRYALAQYFMAADEVCEMIANGTDDTKALNTVFNDRVLDVCLKAIAEMRTKNQRILSYT